MDVGATVVEVDTQTANQSITLTQSMIVNLPTNLRSPFTMVHATAGVTAPATGISQSAYDQNQDRFGLNGGRSTTTGVLIDGVNASAGNSWNGLLVSPSLDSVAEVQVIRNAYDSQYARSGGGMVSIVTKGGSGDFHGAAIRFPSQLGPRCELMGQQSCRVAEADFPAKSVRRKPGRTHLEIEAHLLLWRLRGTPPGFADHLDCDASDCPGARRRLFADV